MSLPRLATLELPPTGDWKPAWEWVTDVLCAHRAKVGPFAEESEQIVRKDPIFPFDHYVDNASLINDLLLSDDIRERFPDPYGEILETYFDYAELRKRTYFLLDLESWPNIRIAKKATRR